MLFVELTTLDFIIAIFNIIFIVVSVITGLKIALKYIKYKEITLLLIGLTWILIPTPWLPAAVSFLTIFFTGNTAPPEILFIIGTFFLPIVLLLWITAFSEFIYKSKQKIFVGIFFLGAILFYVIFFTLLSIDSSLIGVVSGPTDINYKLFVSIYQMILLLVIGITGTRFSLESLRSEDSEIKLKGKFLLLAFYSFIIGSILDVLSGSSIIILILGRIILIWASFIFYYGFFLPNWTKKIFLKERE